MLAASHSRTPLVIGIDARAASELPGGRGRVVRELLRELNERGDPHRYRLYARRPWGELDARFSWVAVRHRGPLWHLVAARNASRECDVFLSCNSNLMVWLMRAPTVPIIHDLVSADRTLAPSLGHALLRRATIGLATRRAAAFIAVSAATARDLVARFPRCAGRVSVALLGSARSLEEPADAEHGRDAATDRVWPVDEGFVLAVGTLEPRKNLPRLARAFQQLPAELQRAHPLMVAGANGWRMEETLAALRALGDRARILGYVSDAELAQLYRRSAVLCYPSLGEGFGLPVLEAMAAGTAVVTSNVSSLPEVGGDAVEYADPRDISSIAAALRRVLEDPGHRADLAARGLRRSAEFSWAKFAATTLEVLEGAAAGSSRAGGG